MSDLLADALARVSPAGGLPVLLPCPHCQRLTLRAWGEGLGVFVYCSWRCWRRRP